MLLIEFVKITLEANSPQILAKNVRKQKIIMITIISTLMTFLVIEAVFEYYMMNGYSEFVEMIYTVLVVGVMTKFLFTTKFFIDKKLDKHRAISKPISKRLYIKISLLFVVVLFNLLTQLYRLV